MHQMDRLTRLHPSDQPVHPGHSQNHHFGETTGATAYINPPDTQCQQSSLVPATTSRASGRSKSEDDYIDDDDPFQGIVVTSSEVEIIIFIIKESRILMLRGPRLKEHVAEKLHPDLLISSPAQQVTFLSHAFRDFLENLGVACDPTQMSSNSWIIYKVIAIWSEIQVDIIRSST